MEVTLGLERLALDQPYTLTTITVGGGDPRAAKLAAHFYFLNDDQKDEEYKRIKAMADTNRLFLKNMQGTKIQFPPDTHVATVLKSDSLKKKPMGRQK